MTKGKNPMKNLRGRMAFTRNESYDQPDGASPANPWDRMLQQDEGWQRRPARRLSMDFATVLVLLAVGALVIGAVLLLK